MKVRHIYKSFIPKLLGRGVGAITLYPFVFYAARKPSPYSISHELVHIAQIKDHGVIRFYLSYILYYLAGRAQGLTHAGAYIAIPYEAAAYDCESNEYYLGLARAQLQADVNA